MDMLAWYVAVGGIAGFCGGLVGIGGGLIVVPVLAMLFASQPIAEPLVMPLALGTSLASIVFTSLSGIRAHHRRGAVDWQIVRGFAPGLTLGAILGGALSGYCSSSVLKLFFLAFALIAATQMLMPRPAHAEHALPHSVPRFAAGSAIAGFASLVGCSGASIAVPYMTRCAVPMRNAIGSASAFALPVATAGAVVYMIVGFDKTGMPPMCVGFVHVPAVMGITVGTMLAVPLGAALSHRLPVTVLKKCFALMLYAVAGKMLMSIV